MKVLSEKQLQKEINDVGKEYSEEINRNGGHDGTVLALILKTRLDMLNEFSVKYFKNNEVNLRYYGLDGIMIYGEYISSDNVVFLGSKGSIILIDNGVYEIVNVISWLHTKHPYVRIEVKELI